MKQIVGKVDGSYAFRESVMDISGNPEKAKFKYYKFKVSF